MLDFQRGQRPRNFLARREQWRLLILVMMLGLVVILMSKARDPDNYRWLAWFVESAEGGAGAPAAVEGTGGARPHDPRDRPGLSDNAVSGTAISQAPAGAAGMAGSRYFPGVDESVLEAIRDDRPVGPSEWPAWLHFLQLLTGSHEATLRRASAGSVSYVQLFEQSAEYRGELVTTGGTIRR
ncbi:MAG: hypothetical protein ACYTG0_31405, partial [Planctomycetota bacterium]